MEAQKAIFDQIEPVSPYRSILGWKEQPIEECGEPLVPINHLAPNIRIINLFHQKGVPHATEEMYLRDRVASM